MLRILSLNDALRAGILLSLCLSLFSLSSCSDDDEDPDPDTAPTVSFKNLANNSTVWNTVSATIEVNDDKGVAKLEVYVDDVLHQTLTAAPYELAWDTKNASEGTHTIKVVVTDEAGNEAKGEVAVVVKNVLFSMDVAADQLNDARVGFIILTDDNGEVIASTEYHNGDHVELRAPDFNGEKFTLTEVFVGLDLPDDFPIRMWTYTQMERGSSWVAYKPQADPNESEANLTFTNAIAGGGYYRFVTSSNDLESYNIDANFSTTIDLVPPSSKLYTVRYNDDPSMPDTYRIFQSIVAGNNASINLSQVNQPLSSVNIDLPPGAHVLEVNLNGYPVAGNYSESYQIGYFASESTPLQIQYPGTAFPSYYSETFYRTDEFYFESGRTTAFYNLSPFSYAGDFSVADNKLNYSASGNFDFTTISWASENDTGTNTRWVFVLPNAATSQSITIPVLTETLTDLMTAAIGDVIHFAAPDFTKTRDSHGFHEYESLEGYDGLKTFIKTSNRGIDDLVDGTLNYTSLYMKNPDEEEGRVGAPQEKAKAERRVRRKW